MDSYDYGQSVEKIVKGGLTHTIRKGVQMHTTPELASLLQKQAVAKSLPPVSYTHLDVYKRQDDLLSKWKENEFHQSV